MTPKVEIVLLNWNQKDLSLACLSSLSGITYPDHHIIFVDNGSEDGSVPAVKEAFPGITVIENRSNLGVAGGRNVGIARALAGDCEYVLLLDNDTLVDPQFLDELVRAGVDHERAGILTGKIYFSSPPDLLWSTGASLDLFRLKYRLRGFEEKDSRQYEITEEVGQAPGCCMLIRRRLFDELGLLDESYVQYFGEDTDFCLRAHRRGYGVLYVPGAKLWHHVVKKTTVSERYWYLKGRNALLFMRKNARIHHWTVFVFYSAWSLVKLVFREGRNKNLKRLATMIKGSFQAFKVKK